MSKFDDTVQKVHEIFATRPSTASVNLIIDLTRKKNIGNGLVVILHSDELPNALFSLTLRFSGAERVYVYVQRRLDATLLCCWINPRYDRVFPYPIRRWEWRSSPPSICQTTGAILDPKTAFESSGLELSKYV